MGMLCAPVRDERLAELKEETKVDGFQEPGSFSQRVTYLAPKEVRANKVQQIKFDLSRVQDSS